MHTLISSLLASFHYVALAIGLGSLFMRGRYLRELVKGSARELTLSRLFTADNLWGVAAILWILTGSLRAFAGYEKGTAFYLHSPLFWIKMGLFAVVGTLEIRPMMTFIRARIAIGQGNDPALDPEILRGLIRIGDWQVALVLIIPFVASAMARGIGL